MVEAVRLQHPQRAAGIRWNIEIKSRPEWDGLRHPPIGRICPAGHCRIARLGIDQTVNVQSFDRRALKAMHRQAPDIQLAYLIENALSFDYNMDQLGLNRRFIVRIINWFPKN
ncbi:MAG: hypothetical protein IPL27_28230 [Lewinellaceae bacterium]|nr:hypothetical protein [Lewinellaceae bacterium]